MKSIHRNSVIQITAPQRGAKAMSSRTLKEHLSENARQSFCAEGVRYSKTTWNRIKQKLQNKRHLAFNQAH